MLTGPRLWLGIAAIVFSLSPVVPAAAGSVATAAPIGWGAPGAFDFGNHTYGRLFYSLSCASSSLCVAGDESGNVVTSTDPTGGPSAWAVANLGQEWVGETACAPSTTFCVAVLGTGDKIFTSSNPTGGASAWAETDGLTNSISNTQDRLTGISCPTASFCVAADQDGSVIYSTDPTGGASAWTKVAIGAGLQLMGISCPSTSLCVAVGWGGQVVTSTNPTGDASAWKLVSVSPSRYLTGVSCLSTSLCLVLDMEGDVVSATDPTGDASAWTNTHIDDAFSGGSAGTISCTAVPSALCVVGDPAGNVLTSTDPAGGASAWNLAAVNGSKAVGVLSCPVASFCAAASSAGIVLTSTNPTGGGSAWTKTLADSYVVNESNLPTSVSCPSMTFCAAVDSYGNVVVSTDPLGGASTWTQSNIDGSNILSGISCPSASLCIAVDNMGNVLSSTDPTGGSAAWSAASIDAGNPLTAVSCPSTSFCAAVDSAGEAFTSTAPTGGAPAWTSATVDVGTPLTDVSCASEALCVATEGAYTARVAVSTDPTAPTPAWSLSGAIPNASQLNAASCPTSSFCIVGDENGDVFKSTDPSGGGSAWSPALYDSAGGIVAVSCVSTSLCVADDFTGSAYASTDPVNASTGLDWTGGYIGKYGQSSVSCPTTSVCVAASRQGFVSFALVTPSVTLGPVESIGPTSATLTGTVNPNGATVTDCHFAYGVGARGSVPYDVPCSVAPGSGTNDVTVTATLTGLSPQTTYEYALFASNSTGVIVGSNFPSFTTTALPPPPSTLTVATAGIGYGLVSSSPAGIDCGSGCSYAFTAGTSVTLTAVADPGSVFEGWSGDCSGSSSTCELSMTSAHSATATFGVLSPPPPPPVKCHVPKLIGKKLRAARTALKSNHCALGSVKKKNSAKKKGVVLAQTRRPGVTLLRGAHVGVTLSKGKRR